MAELCECKTLVKNDNKNKSNQNKNKKNNLQFYHFPVWYFADVSDTQWQFS